MLYNQGRNIYKEGDYYEVYRKGFYKNLNKKGEVCYF